MSELEVRNEEILYDQEFIGGLSLNSYSFKVFRRQNGLYRVNSYYDGKYFAGLVFTKAELAMINAIVVGDKGCPSQILKSVVKENI
jgi:hypothetical protein